MNHSRATETPAQPQRERARVFARRVVAVVIALATFGPVLPFLALPFLQSTVAHESLFSSLIWATCLLGLSMLGYVVHATRNALLDQEKRSLWVVLLFVAYPLAMPAYWWTYIWPNRRSGA